MRDFLITVQKSIRIEAPDIATATREASRLERDFDGETTAIQIEDITEGDDE